MRTLYISLRLLRERIWTNLLLLLEILLSVILFSQMTVYIAKYVNTQNAVKSLNCENVRLVFYDAEEGRRVDDVLAKIASLSGVDRVDTVFAYKCVTRGPGGAESGTYYLAAYTDGLTKIYRPLPEKGVWLDEATAKGDMIPIVVTRDTGWNVGEETEIMISGQTLQAYVCGVLDRGGLFICPQMAAGSSVFSSDMLFCQSKGVMMRSSDVPDTEMLVEKGEYAMPQQIFVTMGAGKRTDTGMLDLYGESLDLSEANEHYYEVNGSMIRVGVIAFVVIFAVAVSGLIVSLVTQAERDRRRYTVYYLSGMKWQKCGRIEALRMLILLSVLWLLTWVAARYDILMAGWVPARFEIIFYALVAVYPAVVLLAVDAVFIVRLMRRDISVQLKELGKGE